MVELCKIINNLFIFNWVKNEFRIKKNIFNTFLADITFSLNMITKAFWSSFWIQNNIFTYIPKL